MTEALTDYDKTVMRVHAVQLIYICTFDVSLRVIHNLLQGSI